MTEQPLVCICIPTYNAVSTVRETLLSILSQTYQNLVVHISDNASTDDTVNVVESMADSRVRIYRQAINVGAEENFNNCIRLAEGKYTAIFHADDLYEPEMVSKQVAYLESQPKIGAVFTQALTIDELGHAMPMGIIGRVPGSSDAISQLNFQELLRTTLEHHNFLICPSVMVRTHIYKEGIKEWGNTLYKSSSDVDVWFRLSQIAPIAVLAEPLMKYRISTAQFSNRIRNRIERTDFFLVMDDYLSKPEVRAFIGDDDIRHYRWLERHERTARAINLCVLARNVEAKRLLKDVFVLDALHAAISTRRGLVTFVAGLVLRVALNLNRFVDVSKLAKAIKKISWR